MTVPVLKQGMFLIATIQSAISDEEWMELEGDLVEAVGRFRCKGVVVDVTALDVMDSYATRTLRGIAQMVQLRGAEVVIVGIQPEVAFSMVQLGLTSRFAGIRTELDLDSGLALLSRLEKEGGVHGGG